MAEYEAGYVSRAGEKINLRVDDDGNWLARVASRDLKCRARDALITEIDRVLRLDRKAVHIPVSVVEKGNNGYITVKHGVVTGIHGSSGNLLISYDGGGSGQITGYGLELMKRLDDGEEKTLRALAKKAHDAGDALREFTGRHRINRGEDGLKRQVAELLEKGGQ